MEDHQLPVGEKVIVRTVTMYYTGRLVKVSKTDIILDSAAWVASTGRWSHALRTGELDEVEPFPGGTVVTRAVIVDVTLWPHELPREVK